MKFKGIFARNMLGLHYLLIFILTLAFSSTTFAKSYETHLNKTYPAVITKITDGDTVWVRMQGKRVKLRLLGIDTPEKYSSRKLYRDARKCGVTVGAMKRLGRLATYHAEKYLYKGQRVRVATFGKGYYRRTLAYIILPNGKNFNELMVADGYACVYTYHGHKSRQISQAEFNKLLQLMFRAKKDRRGLWGESYKVMDCLCESF